MAILRSFTFITLNGFYSGLNHDISWHRHGREENQYAAESLQSRSSILLFGSVTYQMMASYWSSPEALQNDPVVAEGMNDSEKIVVSRSLNQADWANSRLIRENVFAELKKLKKESAKDITVLGSGSLLAQLAGEGLVDEFQVMLDPVAIPEGKRLFEGMPHLIQLELMNSKIFPSGVVLLNYRKKQ